MKNYKTIIGAIIGDVIGMPYEFNNTKDYNFEMFLPSATFTDDTVLTVAIADCILHDKDFTKTVWEYGRKYTHRGYGGNFSRWLHSDNPQPYNSYGNGSAMRVSPVGFAFDDIDTVMDVAEQTAVISHNHPEGIKGAQATATAILLARQGKSKDEIKNFIETKFNYNLNFTIDGIRPFYRFDVTCQGSVPVAIVAFLDSKNFEDAIRLAISVGGDSDTIGAITGAIAAAYYKEIPQEILNFTLSKLPAEFIEIIDEFEEKYG